METYAEESVITEGKIDITRVDPLLFDMASLKYWSLGQPVAECWNVGKSLKKKLKSGEQNRVKYEIIIPLLRFYAKISRAISNRVVPH